MAVSGFLDFKGFMAKAEQDVQSTSTLMTIEQIDTADNLQAAAATLNEMVSSIEKARIELDEAYWQMYQQKIAVIAPNVKAVLELKKRIIEYAKANKTDLLDGVKGKTVDLGVAKIAYRDGTDKVQFASTERQAVIELEQYGLTDCVNTNPTVDKNMVKKLKPEQLEQLQALSIEKGTENVLITPTTTKIPF